MEMGKSETFSYMCQTLKNPDILLFLLDPPFLTTHFFYKKIQINPLPSN